MENYNEIEKALSGNIYDLDTTELEQELNELISGPGSGGTPGKKEEERKGMVKIIFFIIQYVT